MQFFTVLPWYKEWKIALERLKISSDKAKFTRMIFWLGNPDFTFANKMIPRKCRKDASSAKQTYPIIKAPWKLSDMTHKLGLRLIVDCICHKNKISTGFLLEITNPKSCVLISPALYNLSTNILTLMLPYNFYCNIFVSITGYSYGSF